MIKPLTRPASRHAPGTFADTTFLHSADDEDYSGFAPTQLFTGDHGAASAGTQPQQPSPWATARWVAKQEARAHAAADRARTVIAAQRRAEFRGVPPEPAAPRSRLARFRAAVSRLLPDIDSLLPLFIGVAVMMALLAAVLPLFDKP